MSRPLLYLFLYLIMATSACGGKQEESEKYECIIPAPVFDTLTMDSFTYPQRQAWDKATETWYKDQYFGTCLHQLGFELNCTDCTNLGIKVALRVDGDGKILQCLETEARIYCHDHSEADEEKVKACLLESFPKVVLPEPFYQKILMVYLGRVPSC